MSSDSEQPWWKPRKHAPGLRGVYQMFPQVARIGTDYMYMPDYCREGLQPGTVANEDIHAHDFKCMVTNHIGPLAGAISDYVPYWISELCLLVIVSIFWNTIFFRHSHHVFVDMFLLRTKYPSLFEMMADKERQIGFYQERRRALGPNAVDRPGESLKFPQRYDIFDPSSLPIGKEPQLCTARSTVSTAATASPDVSTSSCSSSDDDRSSENESEQSPSKQGLGPLGFASAGDTVAAPAKPVNTVEDEATTASSGEESVNNDTTGNIATGVAAGSARKAEDTSPSTVTSTSTVTTSVSSSKNNVVDHAAKEQKGGSSSSTKPVVRMFPLVEDMEFVDLSVDTFPVFVKPKKGAYGEDCHIRDLVSIVKNRGKGEWSDKRLNFLLFEQLLQNSTRLQHAMKQAGITKSLTHPLVTLRVWTKRYRGAEQRDEFLAALLVGQAGEDISNSKQNSCYKIEPIPENAKLIEEYPPTKPTTTQSPSSALTTYGIRIPRPSSSSNKKRTTPSASASSWLPIPEFVDVLKSVQWLHDQTPEIPMLGSDFALCDDGHYLLEVNPMCSFVRYAHVIGEFYTVKEVDEYCRAQETPWEVL